ncbi:MAG TPA: hypothetical protein VM450_01970 [Thermomicrobiales bacterium]|nr:hypothetical protein [Thermomicrobiales bacterium]
MAQSSGLVQRLKWLSGTDAALVYLGPSMAAVQVFLLSFTAGDLGQLAGRRAMSATLVHALTRGLPVTLTHTAGSSEIEGVDVRFAKVRVDAIEVTQSIQNLTQTVPLVALKPTIVRVYLSSALATATTVRGTLAISRGSQTRFVTSLNSVVVDPAAFGQVNALRRDVGKSLNFLLPVDMTTSGALDIQLSSLTETTTNQSVTFGPPGIIDTVSFTPAPPMRLALVSFTYQQGTPPETFIPTATDVGFLLSWLRRAYPVAQVVASQQVVTANPAVPFDCGQINAQLAAIRALDVAGGVDGRTHYYGLVSDGGFFMRGCSAVPVNAPDPAAVGSGPAGPASWGWDFDGSYADWYGGHEIGHSYGRKHPGFCGESHDDPAYPFTAGQLASADGSFAGFDVGDVVWGLPMRAMPGVEWHDVMTYCNQEWLSSYTYGGIRARLAAEDALGPSGGAGRPDERFPEGFEAGAAPEAAPQPKTLISVVAQVNLTRSTGRIAYVNPLARGTVTPDTGGPVTIRALNPDQKVTAAYRVDVKPLSDLEDGDAEAIVDVILAVDPGTATLELDVNDRLADTYRRPPMARAQAAGPSEIHIERVGETGLELTWEASGGLYNVQISSDRGRTWRTVAVGLTEPRATIHPDNLPANGPVLFRVTATDGFTASETTVEWSP